MIEILPENLQPNQTYYIDVSNNLSDMPNMVILSIKRKYGYTRKLKAVFKKIVPANGHNLEYAIFDKYTDLNSSTMDYFNSSCNLMNYRRYKYYLPTRDAIVKRWEEDTINVVLRNIIGDPSYCFN
jgi:hypothetical protein